MSDARILPDAEGRFPKLLVGPLRNFFGTVGLGNGSVVRVGAMRTTKGVIISVLGTGADEITEPVSISDVVARFRASPEDAGALADLINDQLPGDSLARLGRYDPKNCDPEVAGEEEEWPT